MSVPKSILLASKSYRRLKLLEPYVKISRLSAPIIEQPKLGESATAYVRRMAMEKWQAASVVKRAIQSKLPIVTADTIVSLRGRILQKPKNQKDASRMLRALSGQTHEVISSVCVGKSSRKKPQLFSVTTHVTFRNLSKAEIRDYLRSKEWEGKAGAYAIQGRAGMFIDTIRGSYTSVIGLPLKETLLAIDAER